MEYKNSYYLGFSEVPLVNHAPFKFFAKENPDLPTLNNENKCEVCNTDNSIMLMTCSICGTSIHTYCYDMQTYTVPWTCQSCVYTLLMKESVKCSLCQNYSGALRKFPEGWMHSICAKWPKYDKSATSSCKMCGVHDDFLTKCEECTLCFHPFCGFLNGMRKVSGCIKCEEHLGNEKKLENKQVKVIVKEKFVEDLLVVNTVNEPPTEEKPSEKSSGKSSEKPSEKLLEKPLEKTLEKPSKKPKIDEIMSKAHKNIKVEENIVKHYRKPKIDEVFGRIFKKPKCDEGVGKIMKKSAIEENGGKRVKDRTLEETKSKSASKDKSSEHVDKFQRRPRLEEDAGAPYKKLKIEEETKNSKKTKIEEETKTKTLKETKSLKKPKPEEQNKKTKKTKENEQKYVQERLNYPSTIDKDGLYTFKNALITETNFKKKCTKVELSNQLEDFLFLNCNLTKISYILPDKLRTIFKRKELFYKDFPEIVLEYSEMIY